MSISNERRILAEPVKTDWSALVGRALEDLGRIARAEMHLFQAEFELGLDRAVDRMIGGLILIVAGCAGWVCIIAALVLGLHRYLMWWEAFAVGGLVTIAVGIIAAVLVWNRPATVFANSRIRSS